MLVLGGLTVQLKTDEPHNSQSQAYEKRLQPGFRTAKGVDDIYGRKEGMRVVPPPPPLTRSAQYRISIY